MQLRAPAIPLINIDPFFNVWSRTDKLTDASTVHWTGAEQVINGIATIDGTPYRFIGDRAPCEALEQTDLEITALSTTYTFRGAGVELTAIFTSPRLLNDLEVCARPVSYLEILARSIDRVEHSVTVRIEVSEQICLDKIGQYQVSTKDVSNSYYAGVRMGSKRQPLLDAVGDNRRIDYGYFYLCVEEGVVGALIRPEKHDEETYDTTYVFAESSLSDSLLFTLAYDNIKALNYFGTPVKGYWARNGKTIGRAIREAFADYPLTVVNCEEFSDQLFNDAVRAGGEKYAELLQLAYRQSIGAHQMAVDPEGNLLFISKECFSGGFAATVDVSYPSIPLYLLYNPELVHGMLRPIYRYATSDVWPFDFAPHDAGVFPAVTGQCYSGGTKPENQMPVEECGNMLVMEGTAALALGNADFAMSHIDLLRTWATYLEKNGDDPENQLCTDDFAGHLAHNCNLSLKAIMGLYSLGLILQLAGEEKEAATYFAKARHMADNWAPRAKNGDGSYRLAYDRPGTFSMKYNMVWDRLFESNLFDKSVIASETASNRKHFNPYGMPLDNRKNYTKSDWLVWTATLCADRKDFEEFIAPLWEAYNRSDSRVPLTDWYDTITAKQVGFQNRTVQGGLFIKLLQYKKILALENHEELGDFLG